MIIDKKLENIWNVRLMRLQMEIQRVGGECGDSSRIIDSDLHKRKRQSAETVEGKTTDDGAAMDVFSAISETVQQQISDRLRVFPKRN